MTPESCQLTIFGRGFADHIVKVTRSTVELQLLSSAGINNYDNRGTNCSTLCLLFGTPEPTSGREMTYRIRDKTVTLRVVGGDEKGSLKTETVKYSREIQGTRTRERLRWRRPAAYIKDRPVLSSERAPLKNKTVTVKQ
jgi:hypothetical protein